MLTAKVVEHISNDNPEQAKRLLCEAVYSSTQGYTPEQRIANKDVKTYGFHEIFIGHTFDSVCILYKFLKKRLARVDRQTILVDAFLYDLHQSIEDVLSHNEFNKDYYSLARGDLEIEVGDFRDKVNQDCYVIFDYIRNLIKERDSLIINHLNNNMNLSDEDIIKEVVVNVEYFNRQIKKQTKELKRKVSIRYGDAFIEKTKDLWDALSNTTITEKI